MSRPWYAFYPEDYRRRAGHLNFVQDAAYRRLLDQYYQRELPLPVDMPAVHRLVGAFTKQEQQAVSAVLSEFFTLEDDGWHNQRADEELAAASEICEARTKSAKTAAAKRWQSHTGRSAIGNADGNASRMPDAKQKDAHLHLQPQSQSDSNKSDKSELRSDSSKNGIEQPELLPDSKPNSTTRRQKNTDEISLEFDYWYQEYPRHEARGDAEKAYRQARKSGVSADELLAGAKRYAGQRRGEDAKFTKLPATWLRARCWLDETPQQPAPNGEAEATQEQLEILKRGALREWADSGKWRNERWIGPAPDDPQTRITPADIAAVPEARMKLTEMRVAYVAVTGNSAA